MPPVSNMINVTVKTLDSQNRQFNVDEALSVEEFKNHIAESVNIPAASQRMIYCGRVLQDTSKLSDHDLDGKVVHLVQRAPPSASARRSLTPPPDLNRTRGGFRGFDRGGNAMYMGMGSMAFPQNFIDPQQVIPPRATHTLSSSRLNVAKRMLRNAENVIRVLENPDGPVDQQPPTEDNVEDEMTPVIEARVIVPTNGYQPLDGNEIISAVQNTIFPSHGSRSRPASAERRQEASRSRSQPETPRSTSAENLNAEPNADSSRDGGSRRPRTCRGSEMSTLLTMLNDLQVRFAPFLSRYQNFMQEDPVVPQEDLRQVRLMLNRVSKVMHYLGHAYHSLSDIIIDVDQPPPRLLLCRPILIQPPSLVQTGIPIQVEAQINLSADRPPVPTRSSDSASAPPPAAEGSSAAPAPEQGSPRPRPAAVSVNAPPGFIGPLEGSLGLPLLPNASMRVFTTPVEIRTVWPNAQRGRPTNNNNNTAAGQNAAPAPPAGAPSENVGGAGQEGPLLPPPPPPGASQPTANQPPPYPGNGGNLEFFMEVTPETFRGGNLLQSLMQLVGNQLGDMAQAQAPNAQPGGGTAQGNAQQSQARSTQTNPTTATHTRSTPRPHVHMTQQAVQGGFDPFLHCYSHHIAQARPQRMVAVGSQLNRQEPAAAAGRDERSGAQSQRTGVDATDVPPSANQPPPNVAAHLANIIGVDLTASPTINFSHLAELFGGRGPAGGRAPHTPNFGAAPTRPAAPQRGAPEGQNATPPPPRPQQDFFSFISGLMEQNLPDLLRTGPTLDVYVQSFNPDPYVEGESLIIDLIMLMLRNLRINDLFAITSGNLAPLERQIAAIQNFFLTQVCQNDTSDSGIARATERVMADFAPIISALESVPPRENIDMVRSIDNFFRHRVPQIIRLAINCGTRSPEGSASQDASNLLTTIWTATREMLALAVHCSANGQQGVETACNDIILSTIFNNTEPTDLHRWTIANSRIALSTVLRDLNVRTADIEQYVVRRGAAPVGGDAAAVAPETMQQEQCSSNEPVEFMEVDSPGTFAQLPADDPEPLPSVIWGSESWHGQTPDDWVPIITRDVQRQRRQGVQPPFSDAYLSGMPSKRRKLIGNSKPQGSLPQVISESVRQAVQTAGLTAVAPIDAVAREASESLEIQSAYRSLLQSTVQASLLNNEDFDPERYPNAALYFSESPPPE